MEPCCYMLTSRWQACPCTSSRVLSFSCSCALSCSNASVAAELSLGVDICWAVAVSTFSSELHRNSLSTWTMMDKHKPLAKMITTHQLQMDPRCLQGKQKLKSYLCMLPHLSDQMLLTTTLGELQGCGRHLTNRHPPLASERTIACG